MMKTLFAVMGKNKVYFFLTLGVGIAYCIVSVASPTLSGQLVSAVVGGSTAVPTCLVLFLISNLLQMILYELDQHTGNTLKIRQKSMMRRKAFKGFYRKESGREDISGFVSYINNDIPNIAEQYVIGTIDILKCVCLILFSAASLFSVHWVLAAMIIGISFLIVFVPNIMRRKSGTARSNASDAYARYNTTLQSALGGLSILKAYNAFKYAKTSLEIGDYNIQSAEKELLRQHLVVQGITALLQVAKTVAILLIGVYLISNGGIEVGGLVAALQLSEMISAPIEVLSALKHGRNEIRPIAEKYAEMIYEPCKSSSAFGQVSDTVSGISLTNVTYEANGISILNGITVDFKPGRKYLIIGASGSGKSTLLRLIAQIGDTRYQGEIIFNKHEARTIATDDYHHAVCPVFQESYLFYAPLKENICLGADVANDMYCDVIQKLNLNDLVGKFKGEELTPEIVEKLSGGERQRIMLARAMVRQPSVYLLDEVTSSLDCYNSDLIENIVLNESAMVIHVCHKPSLSNAEKYDGIYRMKDGKLMPVLLNELI